MKELNEHFESERYKYLSHQFSLEEQRRETIEKKGQFYLSFVTLFLGAIFLSFEFLEKLRGAIVQIEIELVTSVLYGALALLFVSLLFALIAIIQSITIKNYKSPAPPRAGYRLFHPRSKFSAQESAAQFLYSSALFYAAALEWNGSINDKKSRWVIYTAISLVTAILSFFVIIAMVTFFSLV